MTDYTELKRMAEASRVANHDDRGPDEAFQEALHPEVVLALIAENEALRQALQSITAQVDGNIRPTVRDCVNGQNNIQDIYGYCDQIEAIAVEAMKGAP